MNEISDTVVMQFCLLTFEQMHLDHQHELVETVQYSDIKMFDGVDQVVEIDSTGDIEHQLVEEVVE